MLFFFWHFLNQKMKVNWCTSPCTVCPKVFWCVFCWHHQRLKSALNVCISYSSFFFLRVDLLQQFMVSKVNLPQSWQTLYSSAVWSVTLSPCTPPLWSCDHHLELHTQPGFAVTTWWITKAFENISSDLSLALRSLPLLSSACNSFAVSSHTHINCPAMRKKLISLE